MGTAHGKQKRADAKAMKVGHGPVCGAAHGAAQSRQAGDADTCQVAVKLPACQTRARLTFPPPDTRLRRMQAFKPTLKALGITESEGAMLQRVFNEIDGDGSGQVRAKWHTLTHGSQRP